MKENYRPGCFLPTLSFFFFFGKFMFAQMSTFFYICFLNQPCGFRKGYSTQYCVLVMLEMWKSEMSVDKSKVFGALLTDLSKAFDCFEHELLTAKLNAYCAHITIH